MRTNYDIQIYITFRAYQQFGQPIYQPLGIELLLLAQIQLFIIANHVIFAHPTVPGPCISDLCVCIRYVRN